MKIVRISEVSEESASKNPLFTGGRVTRQSVVTEEMSNDFTSGVVNFERGGRSLFHTHTSDQILIITSGIGIVATENEEREVTVGDIAHIPSGEKHWHGARKESYMSHITIVAKGSKTTQLEH